MKKGTADGACTAAEIDETAEGHFIISDVTLREDGVLPISGRVRNLRPLRSLLGCKVKVDNIFTGEM